MQTSVLNGQNVGISAGFILVRMPIPRRSHEGGSGNPVLPMPVANHSVVIELRTDQGVAARFAGHCEIQGDRLVDAGFEPAPLEECRAWPTRYGSRFVFAGMHCFQAAHSHGWHSHPGDCGRWRPVQPWRHGGCKSKAQRSVLRCYAEIPQQRSVMHPVQPSS